MKRYYSLLVAIVLLELVAGMSGLITKVSVDTWYTTINRSPLTPPNYMFGIVWTILYAMIACAGWRLWSVVVGNMDRLKQVFVAQLVLNLSWTPIFFYFHWVTLALVCLVALCGLVGYLLLRLRTGDKWSALLLLPYWLWLLLATHLNYYIWTHN